MNDWTPLDDTLVTWTLSDDVYGDIAGRRLASAEVIAERSESEEPCCWFPKLWILNRFRNENLSRQYRRMLQCYDPVEAELRGERVVLHSSSRTNTRVVEIPFHQSALNACPDPRAALRYLANPNLARNVAIAFGASQGTRRTFVLDGDIYIPVPTFEQTARLIAAHGSELPVWLFTMRAKSLEQFASEFPPESSGKVVLDTCESEFILNSWPPEVIRLGDEGMLGLPPDTGYFDERREYSNDSKVAYCTMLRASGKRLLAPSHPVCHLEHRTEPVLPDSLSPDEREQALLEHRMSVREIAKREMLDRWRPVRPDLPQRIRR